MSIEHHSHLYISYTGSDFLMIKACFCVCSYVQNLKPFWHHSNVNKLRSPRAVHVLEGDYGRTVTLLLQPWQQTETLTFTHSQLHITTTRSLEISSCFDLRNQIPCTKSLFFFSCLARRQPKELPEWTKRQQSHGSRCAEVTGTLRLMGLTDLALKIGMWLWNTLKEHYRLIF